MSIDREEELRWLAARLEGTEYEGPAPQMSSEPWPEELAAQGIYSEVAPDGSIRFTIDFDRQRRDD